MLLSRSHVSLVLCAALLLGHGSTQSGIMPNVLNAAILKTGDFLHRHEVKIGAGAALIVFILENKDPVKAHIARTGENIIDQLYKRSTKCVEDQSKQKNSAPATTCQDSQSATFLAKCNSKLKAITNNRFTNNWFFNDVIGVKEFDPERHFRMDCVGEPLIDAKTGLYLTLPHLPGRGLGAVYSDAKKHIYPLTGICYALYRLNKYHSQKPDNALQLSNENIQKIAKTTAGIILEAGNIKRRSPAQQTLTTGQLVTLAANSLATKK